MPSSRLPDGTRMAEDPRIRGLLMAGFWGWMGEITGGGIAMWRGLALAGSARTADDGGGRGDRPFLPRDELARHSRKGRARS
jgi:hypothetical protein